MKELVGLVCWNEKIIENGKLISINKKANKGGQPSKKLSDAKVKEFLGGAKRQNEKNVINSYLKEPNTLSPAHTANFPEACDDWNKQAWKINSNKQDFERNWKVYFRQC